MHKFIQGGQGYALQKKEEKMKELTGVLKDYLISEDAMDDMANAILDMEEVYPETVPLYRDIPEKREQIIRNMVSEAEVLHGFDSELMTEVLADEENFNVIFDKIVDDVVEELKMIEAAENGYDIDQD